MRERTNGRINIKMYPGASLVAGDQTREFTAIRQGVIDLAIGSTINWSPQVKELNLFSLPFLMPDYTAIDALTQGEVGKDLFGILEKQDVVPLAWGENGFREVTNSKRPIRTPDDLKGLKFRVVGSPLFNDTFTALGANPTQMSWADAQPALASGAVDGQENPLTIFTAAKLHTVGQKNVTLWGYVADPLIFVVNKEVWETGRPRTARSWATPPSRPAARSSSWRAPGWSRPTRARSRPSRARRERGEALAAGAWRVRQGDAQGVRQVGEEHRPGSREEGRDLGRGPGEALGERARAGCRSPAALRDDGTPWRRQRAGVPPGRPGTYPRRHRGGDRRRRNGGDRA